MLDLARCMIVESYIHELASSVGSVNEGVALTHVLEAGKGVMVPSTGVNTDVFAGVSQFKPTRPLTSRMIEVLTVPASGTYAVTLGRTPKGTASDRAVFNAAGSALVSGTVDGNTKYSLTNKVLTVHSDLAGQNITVQYTYDLTATESALLYGHSDIPLDLAPSRNVGVITTGTIFTDMWDIASNWGTAGAVYLGAGGYFTKTNTGTLLDAVIMSSPVAGDPFLGLRLHP